jgi:hypothetical protein
MEKMQLVRIMSFLTYWHSFSLLPFLYIEDTLLLSLEESFGFLQRKEKRIFDVEKG